VSDKPDIRNRITEIRKMKLGDIAHNPHNWRGHPDAQRASFRGVVSEVGWAGMPLVYHSERVGGLTYVDGHMRKEELPDFEADVAITDLNDEEADLILATYDPISAQAEANREKLGALLQNVQSGEAGVQALLAGLAEREGIFFASGEGGWADAMGRLPTEDRAPFQQMTFTLHDTQVETVKAALSASKGTGDFDGPNQNINGNALARICEAYVNGQG
jgi:hypothetical protein